jgi:histone-lysine N-methyltransferase SETMAR
MQSLGFVVKHLRWVPHTLTPTQKTSMPISQLRSCATSGPSNTTVGSSLPLLASHDSIFSPDHEQIWLRVEEQPLERPRHTLQAPKMIVTIAWNPLGFRVPDVLPKDITFNAEYYRFDILRGRLLLHPQVHGSRLVIHANDTRSHSARKCRTFCEEDRLRLAVHPPYSPDLAPSNFFLFGHIKHCLQGIAFP